MKKSAWVLLLALFTVALIATAAAQQQAQQSGPMEWAYAGDAPAPTPAAPASPADSMPRHTPTSTLAFSVDQVRSGVGDFHPEDHGPMPEIVAHGRADILRCSLCHLHNGRGRMENAPVAGLPVDYFIQQISDFKNGLRNSAEPRKANTKRMVAYAKALTDDEIKAAAEYFGAITFPSTGWIKVVETKTVPKTSLESDGLRTKLDGNETEPIGDRIIEVPDDTAATNELRDDHSPFTAYVPIDSIKKGEVLVTTGGAGKTIRCTICHGAHLEGIGPVPPIAGRSPSYVGRQLYDMQHGSRKGLWTPLMQPVVQSLTEDDILDICAYLTSRPAAPPLSAQK